MNWTDDPKATGAYWFGIGTASADICWIHNGMVWFAPRMPSDFRRVVDFAKYGKCFYGPLEQPPERP